MFCVAVLAAPYAAFAVVTPPAAAEDPVPVCPVNQPSYYNGQPCTPQPCTTPFSVGMPPCTMAAVESCPPNMTSGYNGRPCTPQPCTPPYAPGVPPCFMPVPTIGQP